MSELGDILSAEAQQALEQSGGIALGAGASTLSILLNKQVEIVSPTLTALPASDVVSLFQQPSVLIEVPCVLGNKLSMAFLLTQSDTAVITDLMMGGEGTPSAIVMDDLQLSAISEAVNQMMGMATNTLAQTYGKKLEVMPPQATVIDSPDEFALPAMLAEGPIVALTYRFEIDGLVQSNLVQILDQRGAELLSSEYHAPVTEKKVPAAPPVQEKSVPVAPAAPAAAAPATPAPAAAAPAAPMAASEVPMAPPRPEAPPVAAQAVQFAPLAASQVSGANQGLDLILDVPLKVTVELGRTRMQIRDVLELGKGSVVELDKLAGEPVDLLVNGKLIARGEVVVIDENFGIRVTDIVSPAERFSSFRG